MRVLFFVDEGMVGESKAGRSEAEEAGSRVVMSKANYELVTDSP